MTAIQYHVRILVFLKPEKQWSSPCEGTSPSELLCSRWWNLIIDMILMSVLHNNFFILLYFTWHSSIVIKSPYLPYLLQKYFFIPSRQYYYDCQCPGFYCIPWRYVCNGIWNCPGGLDEDREGLCSRKSCPGQFKCNNSTICVAIQNTCDKTVDCPMGDDEYLCFQQVPDCPMKCLCSFFSISCSNVTSYIVPQTYSITFIFVTIVESRKLNTLNSPIEARVLRR